jgi:parvulin-like peptidyl-prolyl isomerase
MRKFMLASVYILACFFLARCSAPRAAAAEKPTPENEKRKAKVVAKINGENITVGDVEEKINSSIQPSKYKDREALLELVNSLVDQRLLEQEGMARGYDKIPKVADGVKRVLYNLMQTKYIEENLSLEAISSEEIKKYYDEHNGDYNQPSLVRASHIVTSDEAKGKSLLEQCKAKDFDLRKFRQLATENSEDELTKKRGGDLRYFDVKGKVWYSEETVPKEVAEAAFSINVKVRASVIVTEDKDAAEKVLKEVMAGKQDDASFIKAVKKYSIDGATKARGGDTGWFTIEGTLGGQKVVSEEVASTAFSFQTPGAIVPRTIEADGKFFIVRVTDRDDPGSLYPDLVKTDKGFHVLWVVNRRPAIAKTLDKVEYSIRQRLWQDKKKTYVDNFVKDLEKKYNMQIHEENLDKVVVDLSGLPPSAKAPAKK